MKSGYRVLILPRSTALSRAEAQAMRAFVEQGGVLIADGSPGSYDAHARKLPTPYLSDLFSPPTIEPVTERRLGRGRTIYLNVDPVSYYRDRLAGKEKDLLNLMGQILNGNLGVPEFRLSDLSGRPVVGAEIHVFRNGAVKMVALQRNPQLSLADLGPSEPTSNKRFDAPQTLVLTLPGERFVYDVRGTRAVGRQKRITVHMDPYEPTILSLSSAAMPAVAISGPRHLRLGETGTFALSLVRQSSAALHVFHLDFVDPTGRVVAYYSGNISAPHGRATALLPLAVNDKAGRWEVRVKDVLSGQSGVSIVDVSGAR